MSHSFPISHLFLHLFLLLSKYTYVSSQFSIYIELHIAYIHTEYRSPSVIPFSSSSPNLTFDPFFPVSLVARSHGPAPLLFTHVSPFFRVYLFVGTKIARARVALSQRCSMSIDTGRGLSRCPSSGSFGSLHAGLGNFPAARSFPAGELFPL